MNPGSDIVRMREIARERLEKTPRLHTKAAHRLAADAGDVITYHAQRDNQGEIAVHAAPAARKKLKHLCTEWFADLEIDRRVRIRTREPDGPGYVSEKAPPPPLFMMRGLQALAANPRANPFARMIARSLCLLAFGGFREEQTHLFGVLAISTHEGRSTMYCKTKRKKKDAPTEYAIVPLSGVLNDDGAWMHGGDDLMRMNKY